jgi:hypothetical protein
MQALFDVFGGRTCARRGEAQSRERVKFIKKHPVYVCQMKVVGNAVNVFLLLAYCGNWDNTLYKEWNLTKIVRAIFPLEGQHSVLVFV